MLASVFGKWWPMSAAGNRAQQRVGDGVDEHVGVRMAFESFGMWDFDAAQKERPAFGEGVNVVTDTGEGAAGHGDKNRALETNRVKIGEGMEIERYHRINPERCPF